MESLSCIGQNIKRNDAFLKATGQARYANDLNIDGQLYLKVLRSTVPHAKVKKIDISKASKVPGIVKIFRAEDIPGLNAVGRIKKDQPVLVKDKIRMVGDPLALVAANSLEAAEAALEKINITIEQLTPVCTPEEALKPDAPQIHDSGNVVFNTVLRRGDVDKAFANADIVIENTYQTARNDHAYIEPEAALGYIDEKGRITILSPHQHPHQVRDEIAEVLGLPSDKVRIIHTVTGGAFGGKIDVCLEAFIGLAVYHLRKPVKMVLSRPESLATTSKRLPIKINFRTAARKDGKILGAEVKLISDNGAYAYSGSSVMRRAATHALGPYEVENLLIDATSVYTNNLIGGQMRGFGVTEIAIAHEMQMDELARVIGTDPIELRILNGLKAGSITITGQELPQSVGLIKTLKAVQKVKNSLEKIDVPPGKVKGVGVASMYYGIGKTGKAHPSTVRAVYNGEKVSIFTGAAEIGQGSDTVLKQIAADAFRLPMEKVDFIAGDTAVTPNSGPSSASQQTFTTGNAICLLADKILKLWRKRSPDCEYIEEEATYMAETTAVAGETCEGKPYESYAFATHLVEVLVDKETGQVDVKRVIAAHDVGKAINPLLVEGQIEGGVVMGLGMCLMENYRSKFTNSFREYIIPTILDSPDIIPIIVEENHPLGPFGAKGVGEPSMIPTTPAILSAISNAVGVQITDLPCTAEKLFFALRNTKELMVAPA